MGTCEGSRVIELDSQFRKRERQQRPKGNEDNIQELYNREKTDFPDMKEWSGNRYSGIGIKRMKGYKCNLPIDKLNDKRNEFWRVKNSHRTENFNIWRAINQACVYDEFRSNVVLEENNLSTFNGCINHIVDQEGNHYFVPNYCINDPYFEKKLNLDENVEECTLKLKLYECTGNINITIETSNLASGEELKNEFKKKAKISNEFKLRLFFSGTEIKDEQLLYQYNIQNDFKIMVMKVPNLNAQKNNNKENTNKNHMSPQKRQRDENKDSDAEEDENDEENMKKKKRKKSKKKNNNRIEEDEIDSRLSKGEINRKKQLESEDEEEEEERPKKKKHKKKKKKEDIEEE